ncbi:MAG: hypothetical protein AMXMBFR72_29640 [Betaproteobacteria bacterium]
MSKVFVDVGISLDGFIAVPNARPGNPLGDGGTAIHEWTFRAAAFQERIGSSAGLLLAAGMTAARILRGTGPSATSEGARAASGESP